MDVFGNKHYIKPGHYCKLEFESWSPAFGLHEETPHVASNVMYKKKDHADSLPSSLKGELQILRGTCFGWGGKADSPNLVCMIRQCLCLCVQEAWGFSAFRLRNRSCRVYGIGMMQSHASCGHVFIWVVKKMHSILQGTICLIMRWRKKFGLRVARFNPFPVIIIMIQRGFQILECLEVLQTYSCSMSCLLLVCSKCL